MKIIHGAPVRLLVRLQIIAALSLNIFSYAEPEPVGLDPQPPITSSDPGKDHFTRLTELYAQGTQPTKADLKGWWSGRCFWPNDPNRPYASLLLTAEDRVPSAQPAPISHGPLFPPETAPGESRYAFWSLYFEGPPTLVDVLAETQERVTYENLRESWSQLTYTYYTDRSAAVKYPAGSYPHEWRVRKYQQYFIVKRIMLNTGETERLCYFFAKVRENSAVF